MSQSASERSAKRDRVLESTRLLFGHHLGRLQRAATVRQTSVARFVGTESTALDRALADAQECHEVDDVSPPGGR